MYKKTRDGFAWRYMNSACTSYKNYSSIRTGSFFEGFSISLGAIIRVIAKYATRQPLYSIKNAVNIGKCSIERILKRLISQIPQTDFSTIKLGGPGKIVQIHEAMMNFKCKSHRGRSRMKIYDSLCIVEVSGQITRAYETFIPNKQASTIVPIICQQVSPFSVIWTDEHRSYGRLGDLGFIHDTVCHKYEFVNSNTGTNTQAIESFHNELKLKIKKRKKCSFKL